ncbi:MAG TPA: adenosylcobinamide-phosphate synthase CbiB [Polyangiales bacterium]|nr:adenosylcobinamide-phosphate synthase CbiB [Polyangiales bacterium]
MSTELVLALAFALDVTLSEPPAALHPVVWIGRAIAPLKRQRPRAPAVDFALGGVYTLALTSGCALLALFVLLHAGRAGAFMLEVFLLWSCFALKGLYRAGEGMRRALAASDLPAAREALLSLCSRDPSALSSTELAGATIESLSENASDSVVAPLFYYVLFGVPGALFYRAANTLDAMVGYHGRYEYLGKLAARLDDLLNLIPARLTALLLGLAGALLRMPAARGARIAWRDHARTESPNAGWPMAMAAGLLGVQLDKRDAYVLGAELATPDDRALHGMLRLLGVTGVLAFALAVLAAWVRRG